MNVPQTIEDMMIVVLQQQKETKDLTQKLDNRVNYLENIQPVSPSVTKVLENKRKKCVVRWLGGKESVAYKEMGREVFAEAGRDFKGMFAIPRYDMLQRKDESTAMQYWENWEPSTNTKMKIRELNGQIKLFNIVG